jgi:hypothetical protein
MARRAGGVLAATLAAGVVLSLGSAALAAPVGGLKQFKVPTANSQPRAITHGSDGNRWFTEGTEFTSAPAKIARITPAGVISEFAPAVADGCNGCIITDIAQGPGGILYITSNDPTLMRFNVTTQSFQEPVQMPNTSALGGNLAVSATDVWITDFNNDVVWRCAAHKACGLPRYSDGRPLQSRFGQAPSDIGPNTPSRPNKRTASSSLASV